jgi:hypothetical protein
MEAIKTWWNGKYVPPKNEPGSGPVFLMGTYEKHWTSRTAHVLAEFWCRRWQYLVSTAIAVTGIIIALKKL